MCRRQVARELLAARDRLARMPQDRRLRVGSTGPIPLDRGWCRHDVCQEVRDVLGADRVLPHAAREGGTHRRVAVGREQRMEAIDVAEPDLGAAMRELREVRERGLPQRQQMLALQIALRPFARHGGDVLGAMFGQRRRGARLILARMADVEAAGNDPHAIAI